MNRLLQSVFAQDNDPMGLVKKVVDDQSVKDLIKTDEIGGGGIKSTLEFLVSWWGLIPPYIQWAIYLALAIAMILIIYNGFVIATSWWDESKLNSAKSRLIALLGGVILLFAFPSLIKLIVSFINFVAGG